MFADLKANNPDAVEALGFELEFDNSRGVYLNVKESKPVNHIVSLLTADERKQISQFVPSPTDDPTMRSTIASACNRLIKLETLFDQKAMSNISLPREARATLTRLEDEAARGSVTRAERERFHRFVLEGVFAKEIAKLYGKGWRPIMYIYGGAGLFVAVFFYFFFRERPEVHPWSNEAEAALVLEGKSASAKLTDEPLPPAPVKELALSWNMWCCCLMQLGTNIGWIFIVTWLPRYLLDVHEVPIIDRGTMTMIPTLVGLVGMFIGGQLTDRLAAKYGLKWGRRLPIACSRMTGILAYAACIAITTAHMNGYSSTWHTAWVFTGLMAVVAVSTDMGTAATWAFNQDIGGRQVGAVLGWGNMWGNLGAAMAPMLYNYVLGETPGLAQWNAMFSICMGAFSLSFACSLMIDSTHPIVPEPESSQSDSAD